VEPSRDAETILVVEDEEIVRQLVCEILEQQGYRVLCAVDGAEALKLAGDYDREIHLLVTDVIMPLMNGQELAALLSAQRPGLKVLYVSGYSDKDIDSHGVLDAQVELLEKPFTPQSLAGRVRELLGEPIGELGPISSSPPAVST
jgi:DNA-binding response OmpR family regulator